MSKLMIAAFIFSLSSVTLRADTNELALKKDWDSGVRVALKKDWDGGVRVALKKDWDGGVRVALKKDWDNGVRAV